MIKNISRCVILLFPVLFLSCVTNSFQAPETLSEQQEKIIIQNPSIIITDQGIKNSMQLTHFFIDNNANADQTEVTHLAQYYITECAVEGINSDIAFCQMCLETGFLRFGGLVTKDMNNFCGLGAIDENQPGNIFETQVIGVRAHVQHLKGYGTKEPLVGKLVDNRYKWITPKGKATDVLGLSGTWAQDPDYGKKLTALLQRLAMY